MLLSMRFFVVLMLLNSSVFAAKLLSIDVSRQDNHYSTQVEMILDAPIEKVRELIVDHSQLKHIYPAIKQSVFIAHSAENTQRIKMEIDSCILFFCQYMVKVEDIRLLENGDIFTQVIPAESDFIYGHSYWQLFKSGDKTRLLINAAMRPSFEIPAIFKGWLMVSKIKKDILSSINNIEKLAM